MSKDDVKTILHDRRKELGYTMKDVAKLVGVSEATISRWESGDIANMRRDRISKLADALQISPAVIMGWKQPTKAPLFEVAAGQGRINSDYSSETTSLLNLKEGEFAATVRGSSMTPTLQDGDLVVIRRQSVLDHDGQIALVRINGDESTVKRVKRVENCLVVYGDNPSAFTPIVYTDTEVGALPISIEGIVVRFVREL